MQTETQRDRDLRQLSLVELRAEAQAQETIYGRGEATDDAAGLELFRRAMEEEDATAWQAVMEVYRPILVAQAGRRVVRGLVVEDDGFCVDRAFQRFWQACRNGRVHHFDDLAAILQYLKLCLGSVLLDEARSRRRQACLSIDDVPPEACISADPAAQVIGRVTGREVWDTIDRELSSVQERIVAHLSFVGGLTPREILARHPDKFHDVFDVYRTKRNMIERLRRSSAIRDLLA
ncbi:MAG: sigma-70 family RNA polymerase sigma factor [Chloroflexi bacterium]|nr:sigma-70 family RNA polymerase sigma factor [Chloroflexota bacterium]MBV9596695.1 sigma-70 family RNA polymerase sigma factor [Chloroflexota bacterium]